MAVYRTDVKVSSASKRLSRLAYVTTKMYFHLITYVISISVVINMITTIEEISYCKEGGNISFVCVCVCVSILHLYLY